MKDFYRVEFWDHALGSEPVRCLIHGVIVAEQDLNYVFSWWLIDHEDVAIVESNFETVSVLKSAIIEMVRL